MNLICFFVLLFLLLIINIFLYNTMLSKKNKVTEAYSSLDIMLKRRYDLIPNLVRTIKKYSDYESKSLVLLTKLRNELITSPEEKEVFIKNNLLKDTIDYIFLHTEAYPKLKANENYLQLQQTLTNLEEEIAAARRTYNANVTRYNNFIGSFPNNILASIFQFDKIEWFKMENKENIEVLFDENNK